MIEKTQIGAVILAGGKASRMAFADKALTPLHGVALLDYVLARSRDQVQQLTLSVNHNLHAYQKFGLALISDKKNIYGGPLLGIYSAMLWYRDILQDKNIKYLACFAADVPVFPSNLVKLLADKLLAESAELSYALHQGQAQPLFSLWDMQLLERIGLAIDGGVYGPKIFFHSTKNTAVEIKQQAPGLFFNINTAQDLETAAQLIQAEQFFAKP
jgi:molybdenum cofactor guanylyltransferase